MKKPFLVLTVVLIVVVGCAPDTTPAPTAVAPTSAPTPTVATPDSSPTSVFVSPTPTYAVEVTRDIEYLILLQPDAPIQKLDVYAPTEPGPWPVVVVHHAWFQSKDGPVYSSLAEELAGRGLVVFVFERRSESASLREYVQDNGRDIREVHESWACAVRFARETAADYGGDPGWITVFGHESTGLDTAFIGDDLQQEWDEIASARGGPPPQTECLAAEGSAHVDAYVGYGGNYNYYEQLSGSDPDLWDLTSPFGLVGRNPSLQVHLIHGGLAPPSYIERAEQYHDDLVKAEYDATQMLLGDAEWQIPWSGPDREQLIQLILEIARA